MSAIQQKLSCIGRHIDAVTMQLSSLIPSSCRLYTTTLKSDRNVPANLSRTWAKNHWAYHRPRWVTVSWGATLVASVPVITTEWVGEYLQQPTSSHAHATVASRHWGRYAGCRWSALCRVHAEVEVGWRVEDDVAVEVSCRWGGGKVEGGGWRVVQGAVKVEAGEGGEG